MPTVKIPRALEIQPRLPVSGLGRAYRFYHEILGFACENGEPAETDGFAIMQRDGVGLQLVIASEDHPAGRLTIWIHVEDAQTEHQRLKDKVAIEWGPEVYWYGCREFAVMDPDGHRIIFSSPTDDPATCEGV
jgi:hypothetical protein